MRSSSSSSCKSKRKNKKKTNNVLSSNSITSEYLCVGSSVHSPFLRQLQNKEIRKSALLHLGCLHSSAKFFLLHLSKGELLLAPRRHRFERSLLEPRPAQLLVLLEQLVARARTDAAAAPYHQLLVLIARHLIVIPVLPVVQRGTTQKNTLFLHSHVAMADGLARVTQQQLSAVFRQL